MTETIEAKNINTWLSKQANIPLSTKPLFRITWAPDELQNRIILNGNNSYAVLEPKYPWIRDRWIFEWWQGPVDNSELPDIRSGSYECFYVFEDKHHRPLLLNQKVVEIIVGRILGPSSSPALIKSRITDTEEEDKKYQEYFDSTVETSSDIMSSLHSHEGIIVPSSYENPERNL